jgi:hypothetical protein
MEKLEKKDAGLRFCLTRVEKLSSNACPVKTGYCPSKSDDFWMGAN